MPLIAVADDQSPVAVNVCAGRRLAPSPQRYSTSDDDLRVAVVREDSASRAELIGATKFLFIVTLPARFHSEPCRRRTECRRGRS